jgi:hypothetical protein
VWDARVVLQDRQQAVGGDSLETADVQRLELLAVLGNQNQA